MNKTIFITALFAGSAIVPAAYAQSNSAANQPATTGSMQQSAQNTDGQNGSGADVVVQPSAPSIRVNVPEPKVNVDQAQPQVSVDQPQPVVIVHQPAPRVTVDIPKPQITVRMPKPDVNVSQPQPDVSVSQGKPKVSVADQNQAAVKTSDNASNQAQVNVEQAKAQVNVQQANQPKVRYEQEQAQVQVNQPQGQPNINYVTVGQNGQTSDQQQSANMSSQQDGSQQQASNGGQQAQSVQPQEGNNIAVGAGAQKRLQMTVEQIKEYNIVGQNGNTLGDIQNVVNVNGKLYAVIGSGGFLGLGEKKVAIPLSALQVSNGAFVTPSISQAQVNALQSFKANQYPKLKDSRTITVGGA
ncbi:PRC-barrel domain-containing protein [Jiella sp. M17.18]|uniref:PRC-barrel domain-containing protein n=1 Tax=Jiella sp. M17.18 TaxID=3234247 RepID=UPI0034DDEBDA